MNTPLSVLVYYIFVLSLMYVAFQAGIDCGKSECRLFSVPHSESQGGNQ